MAFERNDTEAINVREKARRDAEALRAFIQEQIRLGAWTVGQRLPTERELVKNLGIARNTVRNTLDDLVRQGLIERQVGRGTFLAKAPEQDTAAARPPASVALDASPADVIECRLIFEPAMAGLAVTRATQADVERMESHLRRGNDAEDWRMFEHWDEALHQAIAEATRNPAVIQMNASLSRVRQQGEWGQLKARSLTVERRRRLQEEHRQIVLAIRNRDIDGAQEWMHRHLLHVRSYMFRPDAADPLKPPKWDAGAD